MKIWRAFILIILSCSLFFGCYALVPEHPSKSKSDFYADRKQCEKESRSYAYDSQEDFSMIDEMSNVRACMKGKGWSYIRKRTD